MRSRDLHRRAGALALVATAVLFAALAAWTMVARSLIPIQVAGTVEDIEVRAEKHPGVDDAWFVTIDGDERHVDTDLAKSLRVGDTVRTERRSRTLVVNGQPRSLHLSGDAEAMLALAPATVLVCAALAFPAGRAPRRQPRPTSVLP
jgi:hypothetical protein